MKLLFVSVLALLITSTIGFAQYPMSNQIEKRITDLISRMTLDEKISLLGGTGFETKRIARLGIPSLNMTDGPVGVRWDKSTAFPVSIAMAATWNPELVGKVGGALAREAKAKGRYMLLGPCVNINRVPHGGRNFESFGEDPYLAARMAVAYVKGVQAEKVAASTKHFAANNQEWERTTINARVDERTLHEIYFPAFKAAVQEAGTWTIMSAYNKLNGLWCSENPPLLNDVLKKQWHFKGFVVSDWGAVHSTVPTANAGLDVEMPEGTFLNEKELKGALTSGTVKQSTIDDKLRRLLRVILWTGVMDNPAKPDTSVVNSRGHQAIALEVAQEGIVLLKNDGATLPLDWNKIKSIAVIGPNAAVARTGGGGSSMVYSVFSVSPLEALKKKVGDNISIRYALGARMEGDVFAIPSSALRPADGSMDEVGLKGEYFANKELSGKPVLTRIDKQVDFDWGGDAPASGVPPDNFSIRWTGKLIAPTTGTYELSVRSDDGIRFYLNNERMVDNWSDHAAETKSKLMEMKAGQQYDVKIEFYENGGAAIAQFGWASGGGEMLAEAVETARASDVAILFVGTSSNIESEGFDRTKLELPSGQAELINAVVKANKNTVVVLTSGTPITMSEWVDTVPAIVESWFAGQEIGSAIVDVLFGDVNPSGKLPVTFLKRWEDSPAFPTYPGKDGVTEYSEGIFVGYRHFDMKNMEVQFAFGHGLSYTTFSYENLKVDAKKTGGKNRINVSFEVKNTGSREGAEVAQVYVHDMKSSVPRPPKELKAFKKANLKPGESQTVTVSLDDNALAFYDAAQHAWVVEPGTFEVMVGSSSRLIRFSKTVDVK